MTEIKSNVLLEGIKEYIHAEKIAEFKLAMADLGVFGKLSYVWENVLPFVAAVVEKIALDLNFIGSGEDKKKALVDFLDDVIDLPAILEPFDGMIIGFLIDFLIGQWNELHGKEWFQDIAGKVGLDIN